MVKIVLSEVCGETYHIAGWQFKFQATQIYWQTNIILKILKCYI